jgi:hypothetical protein
MAELIKELAKHNKEAVGLAISTVLKGDKKRQFEVMLKEVIDHLPSPPAKKRKTETKKQIRLPSNKSTFEEDILPQIELGITSYLNQQNQSIDLKWNFDPSFMDTIQQGRLETLQIIKETHDKIVLQEKTITNIRLLTAYARGVSYMAARRFVKGAITQWYEQEFGTPYKTVYRYQQLAMLIKCFPGILVTGLTFMDCVNNNNEIREHLSTNKQLAKKLRTVVLLCAQGKGVEVVPAQVEALPITSTAEDETVDQLVAWFELEFKANRQETELGNKTKNLAVLDVYPPVSINCSGKLCQTRNSHSGQHR